MSKEMFGEIQRRDSRPLPYREIDDEFRERIDLPLKVHMQVAGGMMKWRRKFTPLLNIRGNTDDETDVIPVPWEQSRKGFDHAYEYAVDVLRDRSFEIALFSYSVKKEWLEGKRAWFLRTIVFLNDGTEIDTVSRVVFRGLFRRSFEFQPIVVTGIRENIFG